MAQIAMLKTAPAPGSARVSASLKDNPLHGAEIGVIGVTVYSTTLMDT